MATYKVLQDIEAEDKLVGPLTLWQFIYGLVAAFTLYLSAIAVMKNVLFMLIFTVPVALFAIFLAVPWGGDQPTEVWAIAKLRFFLKPRRRIWNQGGMTELVTITAPKLVERRLTNGLDQHQVHSRLNALATTLDSRGWAVKNVNINMGAQGPAYNSSDRLVDVAAQATTEVPSYDIRAEDDILDEHSNPVAHNLGTMIDDAANKYRQALIDRMNQPPPPPTVVASNQTPQVAAANNWFTSQQSAATATPHDITAPAVSTQAAHDDAVAAAVIPTAAEETADDEALLARIKADQKQSHTQSNLKTIKTPEQIEEEMRLAAAEAAARDAQVRAAAQAAEAAKRAEEAVLSEKKAAIMNLARSNDFSIATIQRQAEKTIQNDGEVEISLR